jgi:hypothetical protein
MEKTPLYTRGPWVPNWSVPRNKLPLENIVARAKTSSSVTFKHDMTLEVIGTTVTTVALAGPFDLSELGHNTYHDVVVELRRIARQMNLQGYINGKPEKLRELCRVLCSNNLSDQFFPVDPQNYPTVKQGENFLQKVLIPLAGINENFYFLLRWRSIICR